MHYLLVCHFEAASLHFGRRHLGFLEPEVTILYHIVVSQQSSISRNSCISLLDSARHNLPPESSSIDVITVVHGIFALDFRK